MVAVLPPSLAERACLPAETPVLSSISGTLDL